MQVWHAQAAEIIVNTYRTTCCDTVNPGIPAALREGMKAVMHTIINSGMFGHFCIPVSLVMSLDERTFCAIMEIIDSLGMDKYVHPEVYLCGQLLMMTS